MCRGHQRLSQGFFPLIPFTQLQKDLLYEITCVIFEPIAGRLARYFKRTTNRRAGKQRVGVSPGVHHETAAGRSWDGDAGGCGASSAQLGCSDSCPSMFCLLGFFLFFFLLFCFFFFFLFFFFFFTSVRNIG